MAKPTNPKQIFIYAPLSLQSQVRKIQKEYGLPSFSATIRALLRFALVNVMELKKMSRSDTYMPFIDREKKD